MRSPVKRRIIINTDDYLYDRFYQIKYQSQIVYRRRPKILTNGDFLKLLLDTVEEKIADERKKRIIKAY
jgi:hypothetical protein